MVDIKKEAAHETLWPEIVMNHKFGNNPGHDANLEDPRPDATNVWQPFAIMGFAPLDAFPGHEALASRHRRLSRHFA